MSAPAWGLLETALVRWRDAGRKPLLWWRDDDAVAVTPALEHLLDLSRNHAAPMALAVIPEGAEQALADRLAGEHTISVLVHGWSHVSHAPEGQKKQELGLHRAEAEVLAELRMALDRILAMFGSQAVPMLVPPWNRIDARLVPRLRDLGYQTLSVFGPPHLDGLPALNATVDIMDWRGTRGCRPVETILGEFVAQLDAALSDKDAPPVGLLTHHLVHDEAAWRFLSELLEATSRAGIAWRDADSLRGTVHAAVGETASAISRP